MELCLLLSYVVYVHRRPFSRSVGCHKLTLATTDKRAYWMDCMSHGLKNVGPSFLSPLSPNQSWSLSPFQIQFTWAFAYQSLNKLHEIIVSCYFSWTEPGTYHLFQLAWFAWTFRMYPPWCICLLAHVSRKSWCSININPWRMVLEIKCFVLWLSSGRRYGSMTGGHVRSSGPGMGSLSGCHQVLCLRCYDVVRKYVLYATAHINDSCVQKSVGVSGKIPTLLQGCFSSPPLVFGYSNSQCLSGMASVNMQPANGIVVRTKSILEGRWYPRSRLA